MIRTATKKKKNKIKKDQSDRVLYSRKRIRTSAFQKKLILLLYGGLTLCLTRSPKYYFKVLKGMQKEWENINQYVLRRSICSLYNAELLESRKADDGTVTLILSEEGKKRAMKFNLETMQIKVPKKWDDKWRIVIFDIPEKLRIVRNSIRGHLKKLGFFELQKSVWVYPYDCKDEIDFIATFHDAAEYIRYIRADHINDEHDLKVYFNLS